MSDERLFEPPLVLSPSSKDGEPRWDAYIRDLQGRALWWGSGKSIEDALVNLVDLLARVAYRAAAATAPEEATPKDTQ